jgi:uncharacterized protein (DUF983 family)
MEGAKGKDRIQFQNLNRSMKLECVHCGRAYTLRDGNVGAEFACRRCGKISPVVSADALPANFTPSPDQAFSREPSLADAPPVDTSARPAARTAAPAAKIDAQCQHCGKAYRLSAKVLGMQFKCKVCGELTPVPANDASDAPPEPLPAPAPSRQTVRPRALSPRERSDSAPKRAPADRRPPPQLPPPVMPAAPQILDMSMAGGPVESPKLVPREPAAPRPHDILSLLDEGASSQGTYSLSRPNVATPLPSSMSVNRKSSVKVDLSVAGEFLLRLVVGLVMIALGGAITAFCLWALVGPEEYGTRKPVRGIYFGVVMLASGFYVIVARDTKKKKRRK